MIKPKPFIVYCTRCDWEKYSAPRSDALSLADIPSTCAKCGCDDLKIKAASLSIKTILNRLLGG